MTTIVIVHGAWGGSWAWRKFSRILRDKGHEVFTPTLTGLGDRSHPLTREVGLEHHIRDVAAVLEFEDLTDVVLIGHSYGGMVVTGVADRMDDRIAALIYLDAFVPRDGECVFDLQPPAQAEQMKRAVSETGEGWKVPPNPLPPDTPAEERAWLEKRRKPQALRTHSEPIRLNAAAPVARRSYIYCKRIGAFDTFAPFSARARADTAWRYYEMDASHGPHITAPEELARLIEQIIAE
jgi:pimeloyl-ACP methyl ester carboxylesterase